jgi:hypothetical protein
VSHGVGQSLVACGLFRFFNACFRHGRKHGPKKGAGPPGGERERAKSLWGEDGWKDIVAIRL